MGTIVEWTKGPGIKASKIRLVRIKIGISIIVEINTMSRTIIGIGIVWTKTSLTKARTNLGVVIWQKLGCTIRTTVAFLLRVEKCTSIRLNYIMGIELTRTSLIGTMISEIVLVITLNKSKLVPNIMTRLSARLTWSSARSMLDLKENMSFPLIVNKGMRRKD